MVIYLNLVGRWAVFEVLLLLWLLSLLTYVVTMGTRAFKFLW